MANSNLSFAEKLFKTRTLLSNITDLEKELDEVYTEFDHPNLHENRRIFLTVHAETLRKEMKEHIDELKEVVNSLP